MPMILISGTLVIAAALIAGALLWSLAVHALPLWCGGFAAIAVHAAGGPGYFEAAMAVSRIDINANADRSQGDVHPQGNPHIQLDPLRLAEAAAALAVRLGKLDAAHAADFQARAQAFRQAVDARMPGWQKLAANSPGIMLYHKDGNRMPAEACAMIRFR